MMKYEIARKLHTDFSVFEENKKKARSYFIPFSSEGKISKSDYKNERYLSDRVMILSGEWDFKYYEKLSLVPDSFESEKEKFDKTSVPSTWQRTGYDQIAYINTRYPFPKNPPFIPEDVAVGIYRKKVNIDSFTSKMIITFLGVAGAFAFYINGKYVGYSEGSHNVSEFEVAPYLKKGENEILVVNYKWSNGTYLECQDMFRENGIFRDVYITDRKENCVDDFLFRSSKNSDGTYDLKIRFYGELSDECEISLKCDDLFDVVLKGDFALELKNLKVSEWSAELPNIYEVIAVLKVKGEETEAFRTYIGFKDIKIDGEVFSFCGKAIKLLGVNHHDTHEKKGYAMSIDDLERDIQLMKEYNCNSVRTSHYPPDPVMLTMCDMYGLYVVDEADIETHGILSNVSLSPGKISHDKKWVKHYLDRVERMYERDKNHPSITMWSLGNESGGYNCQDVCYDYLKKVNPEIPVHYEGVIRTKRWAYDVVSRMYAHQSEMRKIKAGTADKRYKGKPFFQCEYAHAMGNGPGGLEDYVKLFYSSEQFMGGCIWEWADHSVYDENAKYKYTYGGDHNEPIHDGNFCVDGLFYPNRESSSGALEMKVCYRPIRGEYLGKGEIELWNTRYFTDSSDIKISYDVTTDGEITASGNIEKVLLPGEKAKVFLDGNFEGKDKDIFVNLTYKRDDGFLIAKEQLTVFLAPVKGEEKFEGAKIVEEKGEITVTFDSGFAKFTKKDGLVSLCKNKREYLNQKPIDGSFGFTPHIYRGMIDNDRFLVIFWKVLGLPSAKPVLRNVKVLSSGEVRESYAFVTRGVFVLAHCDVIYKFSSDSKILVSASLKKVNPLLSKLPRFGLHFEMPGAFEEIEYYGRGEEENYSDFKEHSPVGKYKNNVANFAHKYIKPQDSGNRGEVRWAKLSKKDAQELTLSAVEKTFDFNANHFTMENIKKASHIEDIPDVDTTYVSVDCYQRGSGSGSCGPITEKQYTREVGYFKPMEYKFMLRLK